jgi:hypothetical protein
MRNTADVTGSKPIAHLLQSISGVSAINPLVSFYDIHGGKREVLFFCFVSDTTRDYGRDNFNISIAPVRSRSGSLMYVIIIIIISLLMSPLLGHRPSLWIKHKERAITHHAGPVRVGGCYECSRDWLNVPSEARSSR